MKKIILLLTCIMMIHTISATPRKVANQFAESHTMERMHQFTNRLGNKQVDQVTTIAAHTAQVQNETDVENTMVDTVQQTSKIIRNGQLLIIHQNKLYNILGEQL